MNPVPPLPFPGSRTLAAWWRELAPWRPLRLWLCHLLFHRVEALADVLRSYRLDDLRLEVLRSLVAGRQPAGLDPGLFARLTRELTAAGLFSRAGAGLQLTDAGRHAVADGSVAVAALERREFFFIDNRAVQRSPHFVRLSVRGTSVVPPEHWEFDPVLLQSAVGREAAWKKAFGFPEEVNAFRLPVGNDPDWRSIVFDQAEYLFTIFVEVETTPNGAQLLGFAGRTIGWTLQSNEPALALGRQWEEALPDLTTAPDEAAWRTTWQAWGQQRALPAGEMMACRLERSGLLLRVEAPHKLIARLREDRSDALKGETWLLAGAGRTRAAARVELTERES
jgi:hypothetical protein